MDPLHDYEFAAVAPHLVNVAPKQASRDPKDVMNLTVPSVDLTNVPPTDFLSNPARFIQQLKAAVTQGLSQGCAIGPGLSDKAPGITIHLPSSTVRQDLNLVSEFSIDSAIRGAGFASGWIYFRETSPSKVHPAHAWRATDVIGHDQLQQGARAAAGREH